MSRLPAPSLRTKLFLAFLSIALFAIVSSSFLAVATSAGALRQKVGTFSVQLVGQIALNLDGEYLKLKGLSDEVLFSPEFSSRMVGYATARANDQAVSRYIFGKVLQSKFLNLDRVDDVVMLLDLANGSRDLVHLASQYTWSAATLGALAQQMSGRDERRNWGLALLTMPEGTRDIVLIRTIRNSLADEDLGYLFVLIDPRYFSRVFEAVDIGQGADLFVVDRNGLVVSARGDRKVGSQALPMDWLPWTPQPTSALRHWEGQEHLLSSSPVGTTGWSVVGAVPSSYLDSETGKIATQVFLVSLGALMLALGLSLRLAEGFAAPLRRLEQTMGLFGEGMMQVRAPSDRLDEIGRLQRSFNAMADDIRSLMGRIDEEHRRLQISELRVLEYQINPHFLYNTLDSINWMALGAGQKDISAIVTALARFFRLSLSGGHETYRVRDELEHATMYLTISQMRYPDCFRWEFDVDEALLDRSTLKLVLQPLVENAIKHGFDKRRSDGVLRISGRNLGRCLEWKVTDNGRGIPEDKLAALRSALVAPAREPGPGGFGLVNVHQRIRLNAGPDEGLRIHSHRGEGTTVQVLVPWEDEKSNG